MMGISHYKSKPTEWTVPRLNHGLWVMMLWKYMFTNYSKCTTLVGGILITGRLCMCEDRGLWKALCLLLSITVSLKLFWKCLCFVLKANGESTRDLNALWCHFFFLLEKVVFTKKRKEKKKWPYKNQNKVIINQKTNQKKSKHKSKKQADHDFFRNCHVTNMHLEICECKKKEKRNLWM